MATPRAGINYTPETATSGDNYRCGRDEESSLTNQSGSIQLMDTAKANTREFFALWRFLPLL
jgi:hypothetical protein